jgi:hypothetical protein
VVAADWNSRCGKQKQIKKPTLTRNVSMGFFANSQRGNIGGLKNEF